MASKSCGPHVELTSNGSMRVTRCPCGTVHLTLLGSGVTVRMSTDSLRGVASGAKAAIEKLEAPVALGSTSIN